MLEDDAGERVLLLTLDLAALSQEVSEAITHKAAEAVGLADEHVLVSCTHTHSGPAVVRLEGWGAMEPSYVGTIPGRCVQAALAAAEALRPVRVGSAHGTVRAVGLNRVRDDGPVDPGLHVLRLDNMEGEPQVVLFSHGCHPVTIDRQTAAGTAISADWPGQVARRLGEEGFGEAIFRLGACGDINPVVALHEFCFEGMELTAEAVTQALLVLLGSIETSPRLRLRIARRMISLPLQPLTEQVIAATLDEVRPRRDAPPVTEVGSEDAAWKRFYTAWAHRMRVGLAAQPDRVSVPIAALLLNDDAWLHLPGEIFTELSTRILAESPFPATVVTTLAYHFIGYIPDHADFASGGYAATLVPHIVGMPPYSPGVGAVLVDEAIELLRALGRPGPVDLGDSRRHLEPSS
jgi:hypothetical protein